MIGTKGKLTGDVELRKALRGLGPQVEAALRKLVVATAAKVQGDAIRSIQRGPKSGRVYMHGKVAHRASAPGQPPATDTGNLATSIHRVNDGIQAAVGTGLEYGKHLEFGTKNIAARPWLFPALESNRPMWERGLTKILASLRRAKKTR